MAIEDEQFRRTADNMGIPEEHRDNPAVRRHIAMHNGLESASSQVYAYLLPNIIVIKGEQPEDPPVEFGPHLHDRYEAVRLLADAALMILHDDSSDTRGFDAGATFEQAYPPIQSLPPNEQEDEVIVFDQNAFFGYPLERDDGGGYIMMNPLKDDEGGIQRNLFHITGIAIYNWLWNRTLNR